MEVSNGNVKKERNKPCEHCRSRKVKCTVEERSTACNRCLSQGVPCVFANTVPYERKRPSPSSASVDSRQSSSKRRNNGLRSRGSEILSPVSTEQSNGHDESIPTISLLDRTIGLAKGFFAKHIGPSSPFPRPLFDLTPNRTAWNRGDVRRVAHEEYLYSVQDAATLDWERDFEYLDEIEACVAPHGMALINLYFRIVHPTFPILHKKVFLEKAGRSYREFSPALLAAVYILALQWWEYGRDLGNAKKPNEKLLRKLALASLDGVCRRPKLSTVQALLLLAQTNDELDWMLLARTTSVACELGLHLDCSQWIIPSWEKGLRKRLAWAVYVQDVFGSLVTGRPTLIHGSNWMVQQVTETDFPERSEDEDDEEGSTEVEKGRELFTHFISLAQILGQVLNEFWTLTAQQQIMRGDLPTALDKAKPLQMLLQDWYSQLPASLSLDNVKSRKLSSVGYLHLGYYAVQVALHRALLTCGSQAYGSGLCEYDLIAFCQGECLEAFASAAAVVQKFRPEHLQSFWYFASSDCLLLIATLGCELWAGNVVEAERSSIQKLLEDFRWTLRISAKGVSFMKPAVEPLNQMLQALREAQTDQNHHSYRGLHIDWTENVPTFATQGLGSDGISYFYPSFGDTDGFVREEYYHRSSG